MELLGDDMISIPCKAPEPKTVVLEKDRYNKEPYGLKLGTRIVIEHIQPSSLAAKNKDLEPGDMILRINDQAVDNLTVPQAKNIITQTKQRLQLLVKKPNGTTITIPATLSRPVSRAPSPEKFTDSERNSSGVQQHQYKEFPVDRAQSKSTLPYNQNSGSTANSINHQEIRTVVFHKARSIGIRIVGGNETGIFMASVQEGGPAANEGLQRGDQILEVNDICFRKKTREKALEVLMDLDIGQRVKLKVLKTDPSVFEPIIRRTKGDCFYVRTHFDYNPDVDSQDMPFEKNMILCVRDTLYRGKFGQWEVNVVDGSNKEIDQGIVPNARTAEAIKSAQDRKTLKLRENHGARKLKEKILKGHSTPSKFPKSEPVKYPAYETVVLRESMFRRPIVIFGAISDIARRMLCNDIPGSFVLASSSKTETSRPGRAGVVKLSTINDIVGDDKHPVVDITPYAVEKLNKANMYPLVIFLKIDSKKEVKSMRQRYATKDHERSKSAKKLYIRSQKLFKGYKYLINSVVDVSEDPATWFRRLQHKIKQLQKELVWVSEDHETDQEELDDDRISIFSAPDSQYSCTTIGSNMRTSRLDLNLIDSDEESENSKSTGGTPFTGIAANNYHQMPVINGYGSKPFEDEKDDPLPPMAPAPAPPRKDYTNQNPANIALANVVTGRQPTENGQLILKNINFYF